MVTLRQAAVNQLRARVIRRHGRDTLPISINRRRIYILPTRFGFMLGAILAAMLIAGLNYNSNLALAFAFLMSSMALVTMHHCNRNLLRLSVDVTPEVDAFAGSEALFEFALRNDSNMDRRDIEIRCQSGTGLGSVAAARKCIDTRGGAGETPRRHAHQPVRAAHPLSLRLVLFLDLRTGIAHHLHGPARRAAAAFCPRWARRETRRTPRCAAMRISRACAPTSPACRSSTWRGRCWRAAAKPAVRSYSSLAAQPEWLEWSLLVGLDVEARLSQLCLWVLESDAAHRPYGLRLPGKEIAPSGGAAHRFACLRALAAFGIDEP